MASPAPGLRQELGLREATTLIVGSMVGSGILLLPGVMLLDVGSPLVMLLAWVAGAVLALAGALTFAELGTMFPRAGGQYVFLRESMGDRWAFLFGWTNFWVVQAGILAAVASAFALFVDLLVPLPGRAIEVAEGLTIPKYGVAFVAIGCIWLLAGVNYLGTRHGARVQVVFTVAKLVGIVGLLAGILLFYRPTHDPFAGAASAAGAGLLVAFAVALSRSLFAYDGWPVITYVASEVKDPQRTIPRALVLGVSLVAALYILFALAMVVAVDLPTALATGADPNGRIATTAAQLAFGLGAAALVAVVAGISTFGTVNGYVLAAPRIPYAMARDGMFFGSFARLSRFATPGVATLLMVEWASLLALTGVFAQLAILAVFGLWLFYIPTAVGYFRLRRTRPDLPRPYRTPGYPFVPLLFLASAVFVTAVILLNPSTTLSALIGLALIATGVPAHAWFERQKRRQAPERAPELVVAGVQ
ncbi:MAG TPA: APC family permease [Candidatus Thermoplasmatota archaeon]|nr:APC family permease [Candidatus Thermoplasmatota archaeon]